MKRMYVLVLVVAFLALGAQTMASPPVQPPVEGFGITTETNVVVQGTFTEKERYSWVYYEGNGNIGATTSGTDAAGHAVIAKQGWQAGAEIVYQQDYSAANGITTFNKSFDAQSFTTPNLQVSKFINFQQTIPGDPTAIAIHTEKGGLSVVSAGSTAAGLNLSGLLTLCPWATSGSGGYPATNEGIAAGSSFKVTEILGFTSELDVTSTGTPSLKYVVNAPSGKGQISAGMVVELFEGDTAWGQHDTGTHSGTVSGTLAQNPIPRVQSRTSYSEHAAADGVWSFKKSMAYNSKFKDAASAISPINNVP